MSSGGSPLGSRQETRDLQVCYGRHDVFRENARRHNQPTQSTMKKRFAIPLAAVTILGLHSMGAQLDQANSSTTPAAKVVATAPASSSNQLKTCAAKNRKARANWFFNETGVNLGTIDANSKAAQEYSNRLQAMGMQPSSPLPWIDCFS